MQDETQPEFESSPVPHTVEREDWYLLWRPRLVTAAEKRRFLVGPEAGVEDVVQDFFAEKGERLRTEGYSEAQVMCAFHNFCVSRVRSRIRKLEDERGYARRCREELARAAGAPRTSEGEEFRSGPRIPHVAGLEMLRALRPEGGAQLDYGAVLLLRERVHAARAAAALRRKDELTGSPAEVAELVYPWTAEDGRRRIRPGSPSIQDAWEGLRAAIDAPERRLGWDEVGACLGVPASVWFQWVHRGMERLIRNHGRAAVAGCFRHWRAARARKG